MEGSPPVPPYRVTNPEKCLLVTDYAIDYTFCVHRFNPLCWLVVTYRADRHGDGWIYRYLFGSANIVCSWCEGVEGGLLPSLIASSAVSSWSWAVGGKKVVCAGGKTWGVGSERGTLITLSTDTVF